MELVDALDRTFEHTQVVIAGVAPEQLGNPTPCAEWDVRALVEHTIDVVERIGASARGDEAPPPGSCVLGDDPAGQFRTAAAATLAAWRAPGALERSVPGPGGPMPASVLAGINFLDTTTHAWDIAVATGQDPRLPDDVVELALGLVPRIVTPELRPGRFDPEVPAATGAGPTDRLAAFLGRDPAGAPTAH